MTTPPATPDEFGTHMPFYQRGRAWYTVLVGSALAHKADHADVAEHCTHEAERLIGPLEDVDDPDLLRDFIAGAHRQADEYREANEAERAAEDFDLDDEPWASSSADGTVTYVQFAQDTGKDDNHLT